MRYLACILGGFILGSSALWAQSPFLDFGAARQEDRAEIQQWYLEKEIRAGNNPYVNNPYNDPCR